MGDRKFSEEEIERIIKDRETVFGIEGMVFTDKENELARKFLRGEITSDEYRAALIKD